MKNIVLSTSSLTLLLLGALLQQAPATEVDPATLIAALNSKTEMIKTEKVREIKSRDIISREQEENSYVFSLEKKVLTIEFNEEIRSFENNKYIENYRVVGKSFMDSEQIDRERTGINKGFISIVCQDDKKCITRESRSIEYNDKDEQIAERGGTYPALMFHIQGAAPPLAEQISNDLQTLFELLAPPPKPAESTATDPIGKKRP